MTAIAGMTSPDQTAEVERMLKCLAHRGHDETRVVDRYGATFGYSSGTRQPRAMSEESGSLLLQDYVSQGHYARVSLTEQQILMEIDPLGLSPLYYGWLKPGVLCFASEVKALLPLTTRIEKVLPGSFTDGRSAVTYYQPRQLPELSDTPEVIAGQLRQRLENAILGALAGGEVGSWLSGGLDSSAIAALARPHVRRLHTFAAGFAGSPDLHYARVVADHIHSEHHEVQLSFDAMLAVLPDVIYHLESFDPLLERSSISNFLVARMASDYVPAVFSGEGGDELFAGYAYLKAIPAALLADELIDITRRLHNTALQRVDRCASAHGTFAHVIFLDPGVVEYALAIPTRLKLNGDIEKWILRYALQGRLPDDVLMRRKAKFWEGAGVRDSLAQYADRVISQPDFERERALPNGWKLGSKEELLYYRIFRERLGDLETLDWMGRTKPQP